MSVLSGILLFIGKCVLILLLILLLLIAALLFIPFRYRAHVSGSTESSELHIIAEISFCLRALRFCFEKHAGKNPGGPASAKKFIIFGISPSDMRKAAKRKKAEAAKAEKKKRIEQIHEENPEQYQKMKEEARARKEERERRKKQAEEEAALRRKREEEELARATERRERMRIRALHSIGYAERAVRAIFSAVRDTFGLLYRILLRLSEIPSMLGGRMADGWKSALSAMGKVMNTSSFATDPRTHGALLALLRLLRKLLGHIMPGDAAGELTYGFGDPALTGESLAAVSVYYPRYAGKLQINPRFDDPVLDGDVEVRGRVFLCYVVTILIRTLLDSDIRYMIHLYRERKKEEQDHG